MGIPHLALFFSGGPSPAVFNSFMLFSPSFFLSLSLFSCSLLPPLKWSGVPRLRKGQKRADLLSRVNLCRCRRLYGDTTCPFCSVSTLRVWLYSHLRLSPPVTSILLLAHRNATQQMHTASVAPTYESRADAGPLPSNNQHSRCSESHPFLTLHITETLSACSLNQQGVFGGEKDLYPGERLFCSSGVKQRDGGSQKSLMIKKKKKN